MRAIWSGSISFGLVNIPVRLYTATEEKGLDLTMLHKDDLSPIRYARICRADGKEIPWEDIVKGYEYEEGDYIVLTDEDFKKANLKKTKSIEIVDFAKEAEIDSIYFERPYFVEPDKGAAKAYALLREALRQSKKVGIAKFVIRNREHLAILKPDGDLLVLNNIRFRSELRAPEGLDLPNSKSVPKREIEMALKLIDELSGPFEPEKYHDTYAEELKNLIEEKARGHKPKGKGKAPQPTKVPDLMNVLRQSLQHAHRHRT